MNYLTAYLFIVSSGYYITRLPLSPIYFFMLFSLILFSILILIRPRLLVNKILLVPIYYVFYLMIFQLINEGKISASINQIMAISYFIIAFVMLKPLSVNNIIIISKRTIQFSLPLLIIEAYFRLMNPIWRPSEFIDYANEPDMFFYPFKLNSIMYQDSNFVAVFILVLFFFTLYLKNNYREPMRYERIFLFLLAIATISRAVIIVIILFWVLDYVKKIKSKIIKRLITAIFFFTVLGSVYVFSLNDESTLVKLASLNRTVDALFNMRFFNFFFGNGIGNSATLLGGVSAHNIIEALLLETGIIGFCFFIIVHFKVRRLSRYKADYIMFPFLLAGMSLFVNAASYYYAILAIIVMLEQKKSLSINVKSKGIY